MIDYKVMLSTKADSLPIVSSKCYLAIEPEDYSKEEIAKLKRKGYTLLGYISLGSVSDERGYYKKLKPYTLDQLEDWKHEKYLDVRKGVVKDWAKKRAREIITMGFDGLWVDNLDVYEYYKSPELFNAIVEVLNYFKSICGYVMINGGSVFISELVKKSSVLYKIQLGAFGVKKNAENLKIKVLKSGFNVVVVQDGIYFKVQIGAFANKDNANTRLQQVKNAGFNDAIIVEKKANCNCVDGYTQEEVFSLITSYSGNGKFGKQSSKDSKYYREVLATANKHNINTFLLEYTRDKDLKEKIISYCKNNCITGCCISEGVNL